MMASAADDESLLIVFSSSTRYDSLILDVKVWTAFTLSSDLYVCGLLMWSLIRAPTHFENTRGVIHVLLRIIMESMTPPFLGMMAFACMILTNQSFLGP